jgi:hypothetical protein
MSESLLETKFWFGLVESLISSEQAGMNSVVVCKEPVIYRFRDIGRSNKLPKAGIFTTVVQIK